MPSGNAVARLKDGVSIAQAQAEMSTLMVRLDKLHDARVRGWGAQVENFVDSTVGHVSSLLWLLLGAVSIAVSRLPAATPPIFSWPVRRAVCAIGRARRPRGGTQPITRQMLTEALLIGVAAGAIGIGLAFAFLRLP